MSSKYSSNEFIEGTIKCVNYISLNKTSFYAILDIQHKHNINIVSLKGNCDKFPEPGDILTASNCTKSYNFCYNNYTYSTKNIIVSYPKDPIEIEKRLLNKVYPNTKCKNFVPYILKSMGIQTFDILQLQPIDWPDIKMMDLTIKTAYYDAFMHYHREKVNKYNKSKIKLFMCFLEGLNVKIWNENKIQAVVNHWDNPIEEIRNNIFCLTEIHCLLSTDVMPLAEQLDTVSYEDEIDLQLLYLLKKGKLYDNCDMCLQRSYLVNFKDSIKRMLKYGYIYEYNDYIYLKSNYEIEKNTSNNINEILSQHIITCNIEEIHYSGSNLNSKQQDAIKNAMTEKVSILIGGPGTGKTHTISNIISTFYKTHKNIPIFLLAPTGKAVIRAQDMLSHLNAINVNDKIEISTIHKFNYVKDTLFGLFIIDECSMVDAQTFCNFLTKISIYSHIVIVGDTAQLPSIDRGDVLNQLINCDVIPKVELKQVYRQSNQSLLKDNIHDIRKGLSIHKYDNTSFTFIDTSNEKIESELFKILAIHKTFDDIMIITPLNKTKNELQPKVRKLITGNTASYFMKGDYVMQTKNHYDSDNTLYNGMCGRVIDNIATKTTEIILDKQVNKDINIVKVKFDNENIHSYCDMETNMLEFSYIITVHKSQGSEKDTVVLLLSSSAGNFVNRNLIYTAISRAKKHCIIIGSKKYMNQCINRENKPRLSNLTDMIMNN